MQLSPLGQTNFQISRLAFGGAGISGEGGGYGFGKIDEIEVENLLKTAFELGINTFDTAPIYGFGLSEERFGKYLPKEAFIISKGGVDWHENRRVNMTNDPNVIEKMLHQSLQRLNRDVINLYMIHWPDPKVDIRAPLEILIKAREAGKIQHIGLCNTNSEDLQKALELTRIELVQSQFNYFSREGLDSIQNELTKNKIGFMSWGTFDKGILSGRVNLERKFDPTDARSWAPWWKGQNLKGKMNTVEKLKEFASSIDLTLSELALAWQFLRPEISSSLIGWKNTQDLKKSIDELSKLSKVQIEKIKIYFKYQ